MYGPERTDLVVKYYDLAFGVSGEAEVGWYLAKAKASGGPVLDLACGTGRLALLLAREGLEVTGLDQSAGMLSLFREKLGREPEAVRKRVRLEVQSMSGFRLGRAFETVICCDAFFHNLTVEEQMACLERVAEHLAPDGRFVFNLPHPTCDFILRAAAAGGKEFEKRGCYDLEDGSGTLLVEQAQAGRPMDQTITTTLRLTRHDRQGKEVEVGESQWTSRYLFRHEAEHLLYRCGFEVVALVGDYRGGPVTEAGQLIFEAKLAAAGSSSARGGARAAGHGGVVQPGNRV
jgi:SAM-dependent methyltransferase